MIDAAVKQAAIAEVIEREGGYVSHPADRGGPTRWGVTVSKAREHDYGGNMFEMPIGVAFAVYDKDFWQKLRLDSVAGISSDLAVMLFDFGVNSGVSRAAKCLQRLLNVLNDQEKHYPDLMVDGDLGIKTLVALNGYVAKRGDKGLGVLSKSLNSLRIAFCVRIAERNKSQEAFAFGWLSRIVGL